MLVLKRRIGEVLRIGETMSLRVLAARRGEVRLGLVAPGEVRILREEIFCAIEEENRRARLATQETLAGPARLGERLEEGSVTPGGGEAGIANTESGGEQADVDVVEIHSPRLGSFRVPRGRLLEFPQGLIGFPADHRYVVLDRRPQSSFKWMLSVDDPELAFVIADPQQLVADYRAPRDAAACHLQANPADIVFFVIVTIASDGKRVTADLMAPVAVDLRTRTARQLVLEDASLPLSHPLTAGPPAVQAQQV